MDEQIKSSFLSVTEAMKMAIAEAHKGTPFVSPNPSVGCVILDSSNQLLSAGYHKIYGGPHAEVNALAGLSKQQLQGAHVIVTLEPCAHEGKTPSCAKKLASLPIKKITYGLLDPNPLVAGQGAEILKKAGIEVEVFSELQSELEEVCEVFLLNQRKNKIFVALKVAVSLDGQMALKSGESQWITGEKAREHSHYLRSCYDAVMVGAGTIKHDNPSLNIRHPQIKKENKVIVLDAKADQLKNFSQLKLSQVHDWKNIYWCVSENTEIPHFEKGPQIIKIKTNEQGFEIKHLMNELWNQGLRSVYVEGGAHTFAALIQSGWAHRLYLYQAPHLIGAAGGLSWTEKLSISQMKDRFALKTLRSEKIGEDLFVTARFLD